MIEMVEEHGENERTREKRTTTFKTQKTVCVLCTTSKLVRGRQPPIRLLARCCSKGQPEGQEAPPASRQAASNKQ